MDVSVLTLREAFLLLLAPLGYVPLPTSCSYCPQTPTCPRKSGSDVQHALLLVWHMNRIKHLRLFLLLLKQPKRCQLRQQKQVGEEARTTGALPEGRCVVFVLEERKCGMAVAFSHEARSNPTGGPRYREASVVHKRVLL